jgi:hypothetical protein
MTRHELAGYVLAGYALVSIALLTAALMVPAAAQEVISEPGYCAQFYPNANCENKGPGNPYSDGGYWRDGNAQSNGNAPVMQPRRHHHRARKHQS